jgi:hypothetical protein
MDTETIASLANTDRVGDGLDLQSILRNRVCPQVFKDVGDVRWLQKTTTLTIAADIRQKDLPDDFFRMIKIVIPTAGTSPNNLDAEIDGLTYIGEDDNAMMRAEYSLTPGKPTKYWIAPREGDAEQPGVGSYRAIRFNCLTDRDYTAIYTYKRGPVFADLESNVDMDTWMPGIHQDGLVRLLRAFILEDRIGNGDNRYALAMDRYNQWLTDIIGNPEQAKRNFAKFVR